MSRVLQIPGDHPYVQHSCPAGYRSQLSPVAVPSPALSVGWLREHRGEFDVVHLHFGFEHLSVAELRLWVRELRSSGVPLVYTVHDLRNPHQLSPQPHDRQLDVLIPAADAVLTLTAGAAGEIMRRWGRSADVLPHPAVFSRSQLDSVPVLAGQGPAGQGLAGQGPGGQGPVVGIHLKDLRRNVVEPDQVVEAAAAGARAVGGTLRVDLHPGALHRPELRLTRRLARRGRIDLRVHERFSDAELAGYLAGLDAYLLPHRFGTHSGWLEACRDVGTRVVAPSCGYYADQWEDVVTFAHDERSGLDRQALTDAVGKALTTSPPSPAGADFRRGQLNLVRSAHALLYDRVHRNVGAAAPLAVAV